MSEHITLQSLAREAGYFTLPENGAWVTIKGCPTWTRGNRLIKAHKEIGIQHLDIYWATKEKFALPPFTVNRYRRRRITLPTAIYYDISRGEKMEDAKERALNELHGYVDNAPYQTGYQYTLISISHPHSEEVRFYNGEIAVFNRKTIRQLLAKNCLDVITFGRTQIPILEGVISELADAMRLDGLSHSEAYQELLTAGLDQELSAITPQWFYRPKGWYREQYCEEKQ